MNITELQRALTQLRLSGMVDALELRLRQAQAEKLVPLDFLSTLVTKSPKPVSSTAIRTDTR